MSILETPILVPAPPPPPPSELGIPVYGACPGYVSGTWSDATHAMVMTKMQDLFGDLPWAWRVNTQGPNAAMDRDVYNVQAAGGTPYLILYSSSGPRAIDSLPTTLANRYKGTTPQVIFTGPNEPDMDRGSKVHWDPAPLAAFQRQLYDQVKAVDSSYVVGSPAYWKTWLARTDTAPYTTSRSKLTEYIVQQCLAGGIDYWAFHGYDNPTIHATYNVWDWWFPGGTVPDNQTMSQIALSYGVNLPYIMDEAGSNDVNDATQAAADVRIFNEAGNRASTCIIYNVLPSDGYNILLADGTARQAYTDLQTFIASL